MRGKEDKGEYNHKRREEQEQSLLSLHQEQCVLNFCHIHESGSMDSNSKRIVKLQREIL